MRKYIAYAKKYVPNPHLSSGAAQILQNFYLDLRKQHHTLDATPITTRQLESLIRLTQVKNKMNLFEIKLKMCRILKFFSSVKFALF